MNSGRLNKTIRFMELVGDDDGAGGKTNEDEVLILETRTSFDQVKSMKRLDALQIRLDDRFVFEIRKRQSFAPKLQYVVRIDGDRYSITSIETDKVKHRIYVSRYGTS